MFGWSLAVLSGDLYILRLITANSTQSAYGCAIETVASSFGNYILDLVCSEHGEL